MIHLIKNVFTNKQRRKLIKDSQSLLENLEDNSGLYYPGRQTHPTLHLHPDFTFLINDILKIVLKKTGLNLVPSKAWVNWTNGKKKDIVWHNHSDYDYALVYYMKTPLPFFSNGTLFREGLFKAPQNSIIVFPGSMEHTAPSSPFRFSRYTMAMDLNLINNKESWMNF